MARAKKENISKTEVKANTLEKDIKSTLNKKEARLNRLELQRKLKQKKTGNRYRNKKYIHMGC